MKYILTINIILLTSVFSSGFADDNAQSGLPDGAIARLGKGGINILRFSPDGSKLLVGTDVGVWSYDVSDGNATALFTNKPVQVNALALSHDGKLLASGGYGDPTIQLWNMESNTKHKTLHLKSKFSSVHALGFLGNTLISYDNRGRITYWNIDNGDIILDLEKVDPKEATAFSSTTKYIAVADAINKIHIYDTAKSDKHIVLQDDESKGDIIALAITANNKKLVSAGEDEFIRIWDIEQRNLIASIFVNEFEITSVAISDDDRIFASGDANKEINLWNVDNPEKLRTILGHKNTVTALTFSPDGESKYSGCLASGSLDGTIRFWNPDTGEEITTFATGHSKWIKSIAFSDNGSALVSANMTGNVNVWSLNGYQELATFTKGEADYALAVGFTSDAKLFVGCGLNEYTFTFKPHGLGYASKSSKNLEIVPLRMWDITTGEEVLGPWNEESCNVLTISSDNNLLVIYESERVLGWDIDSAEELFDFPAPDLWFNENIVLSPDNRYLGIYESSELPSIFNLEKPDDPPIRTKSRIDSMMFSPDGKRLALLSGGNILIHDLEVFPEDEPEEIHAEIYGHAVRMIFSPDSKILIATGLHESAIKIKLFDVESGQEIRTLVGHTEFIETFAFSHDAKILASGSFDGTVLLWDWEKINER